MLNEGLQSSNGKLGGQRNQCRIHDNIDLTELTNNSFDMENCGYCQHPFVLPIGTPINEIVKYNSKIAKSHNEKMKVYQNTPVKKRGKKPTADKAMSQHLACMCCKMACIDKTNGAGCFKCETACKKAIESGSNVRPFFDKNFQCTCEIYICECQVVYFRHEAKKLAKARRLDIETKNNKKLQPKLNTFYGFLIR